MKPFLKNALAAIAGIIIGGAVNMGIIMISGSIIPPPAGADVTTMEGLQESMHLFQPKHFLMPFLAHALGTLVGALLTAYFVVSEPKKWALFIGCFFTLVPNHPVGDVMWDHPVPVNNQPYPPKTIPHFHPSPN